MAARSKNERNPETPKNMQAQVLKAGTETGSLINHIYSAGKNAEPQIGMGVTILGWTDRHAGTITEISKSGKKIGIARDEAIRTDNNGMSDDQEYEYIHGTKTSEYFTLRKNGRWVAQGDTCRGRSLKIGARQAYHDYSF